MERRLTPAVADTLSFDVASRPVSGGSTNWRSSSAWRGVWVAALLAALCACGGGNRQATRNRTFYDWSLGDGSQAFEHAFPRLDWPQQSDSPRFLGVSVLKGGVQFSRPRNWRLRQASNRPYEPFIHYVSPNAYSFALYQRRDPADDPWTEVIKRYQEDVEATGARILGGPVPVGTARGQGQAFSVERDVEAAKRPLISRSREILLRSGRRVVLVQIVHQEKDFSDVDEELLRAVATLYVR